MKTYNIVLHIPSDTPEIPYTAKKGERRHDDFISHFPPSVQFYLVKNPENHLGENIFSPDFKRVAGKWISADEKIYADLVLGPNKERTFTNIYHNPIRDICRDKKFIENIFPDLTFRSILCNTYTDIQKNFSEITTPIKVLKPNQGSQGRGILFTETIPDKDIIDGEYPYLLQEFFDTSEGFGQYSGIHDFRTIIIDGTITGSFLRIAAPGVLTANVDNGAQIVDFGVGNIPPKIQKIITKVDAYVSKEFPSRYYSIDVGIGKNGEIKIFELNGSPMLSTPSIRKHLALHITKNILKIS